MSSKRWALGALTLVVVVLALLTWFRVGPPPEIEISAELPGIGRRTPVAVRAAEPGRGLSRLRVELAQGDRVELLAERLHEPRPFWAFWGSRVASDEIAVEVGSETVPDLEAGSATIRVTAERAPTWLRHPPPAVRELELPVRLRPPSVGVVSSQVYLAQGGSSAVVYRVGPTAARDGVRVAVRPAAGGPTEQRAAGGPTEQRAGGGPTEQRAGGGQTEQRAGGGQTEQPAEYWFPGYPLPAGAPEERFALFGAPHDLEDGSEIHLVAADDVGNQTEVAFLDRYQRRPLATDTIRLSEGFMARVVPAILERSPQVKEQGSLLDSYLTINRDLRRINSEALFELAARSTPRFLWNQPFRQLPNTRSMASFADRRTYLYEGEEVDRQDHLGFDLASVRRAPVLAANRGVVLLAEYFGIYGNTVVLDHGYGLMTLYAHLTSLEVQPGQEVGRGDRLGATGETGLAGGDHLHFSVLLHGLQVNPLEWWDPRWIENRVASQLGEALVLEQ